MDPVCTLDQWQLQQPWRDGLPDSYADVAPEGLPAPSLALCSEAAAAWVRLIPPRDADERGRWAEVFSGNRALTGSAPISTVYAGHQFGVWAGQLGDGRAHLLGTAQACSDSPWPAVEVQIKGAGRTPYSRFGDGRAVLRSSLREYIASEAMAALGVATTRALCLVVSDLPVQRERIEHAAVLTRLAPSFVRFGHFQHAAAAGDVAGLRRLLDWCIARLLPHCARDEDPALALLRHTADATAELVASWQALGFVHGVMNTDNMSLLGLTLDYGPFAFVDAYDPDFTPNHTDSIGLYRLRRQPQVAQWNLAALAQALLPLLPSREAAYAVVQNFMPTFERAQARRLRTKLGLQQARPGDDELLAQWLRLLQQCRADWTSSWRALGKLGSDPSQPLPDALVTLRDEAGPAWQAWSTAWRQRVNNQELDDAGRQRAMAAVNPCYVPRTHQLQRVIDAAEAGNFAPAKTLLRWLRRPYDEQAGADDLTAAPPAGAEPPLLSCSS